MAYNLILENVCFKIMWLMEVFGVFLSIINMTIFEDNQALIQGGAISG